MFRIHGLATAALATFLWSAAIVEGGHGHGGGGGGSRPHGGGGGRPATIHSAPRVNSGVIHSSGIAPAIHSNHIGPAHITSSGIRSAAIDPAIVGGVSGRRSVSTFAAFESSHHHHHGLHGADLFLFGIGS